MGGGCGGEGEGPIFKLGTSPLPHLHPLLLSAALEDGVAEADLVMAVVGGGEQDRGLTAGGDVLVDGVGL